MPGGQLLMGSLRLGSGRWPGTHAARGESISANRDGWATTRHRLANLSRGSARGPLGGGHAWRDGAGRTPGRPAPQTLLRGPLAGLSTILARAVARPVRVRLGGGADGLGRSAVGRPVLGTGPGRG